MLYFNIVYQYYYPMPNIKIIAANRETICILCKSLAADNIADKSKKSNENSYNVPYLNEPSERQISYPSECQQQESRIPSIDINIHFVDTIEYDESAYLDCSKMKTESHVIKYFNSFHSKYGKKLNPEKINIIHPKIKFVKIDDYLCRCIPPTKIRSVIEKISVYDEIGILDTSFREEIVGSGDSSYFLSHFSENNPMITTCCNEVDPITYPDFVKIPSSDYIKDNIDAVIIDSEFKQNGLWNNVTSVMFVANKNMDNHVCQYDFEGINTLYIYGNIACEIDCPMLNCPKIIFIVEVDEVELITDYCRMNADIIRFNHGCFVHGGYALVHELYHALIEAKGNVRFEKHNFDPDSYIKNSKSKQSKPKRRFDSDDSE